MSGVKRTYVSVEQSQWQEAQAAAARLREVRRDLPRLLDGIRAQARQDAQEAIRPVQARAAATEREIGRLSTRARKFEQETNRRLVRQTKALAQLRSDTTAAFDAQERRFRSAISAERAERERAVAALRADVDTLAAVGERALDQANQWISDADVLAGLIRTTLPAERFAPGRLGRLERDLAAAKRNAADGLGQAALAQAQPTYHELSDLRFELECADREWRALRDAAGEALLVVAGLIEANTLPKALDERGAPLDDVDLDVDHWSGGALAALRAEVDAHLAELHADDPVAAVSGRALTADELRAIVERSAPAFEDRLADVVEGAALAQLGSQIRVNVADLVVQALEASGYALKDHTYVAGDDREAFLAQVEHPDGGLVVIDVAPVPERPASCELRIASYDDTGAEEIRLQRAHALAAALRDEGLDVAPPAVEAAEADAALRDLTTVRVSTRQRTQGTTTRRPAAGR